MKALSDPPGALAEGLAAIRREFGVPAGFPPEVLAAADEAARRVPATHIDRTEIPFVTLDPTSSTDLDQAFAIERSGADLVLRYAIADVAWFVDDGGAPDREAWARGVTLYLPDGRAGLYPPVLSESAASLLPDGPRAAVIFTVRIDADGTARLDGAERAIVRSRAKLAYETVTDAELPDGFAEVADRVDAAARRRGAAQVEPPEQAVTIAADGRPMLSFRPKPSSEARNAALSLATNLAVADSLLAHRTGLFRVMDAPDAATIARLRHTAAGLGVVWPAEASLEDLQRALDPADPRQAAFMLAIRRAGQGARYEPFRDGVTPWHAAMAATYAHATAPLRRLADRYVVRAALAVASGEAVSQVVSQACAALPAVMARADARDGRIARAVVDLAEAAVLQGREGEAFAAVVTDADPHGARVQLRDPAVVARIDAPGLVPGQSLDVRLEAAEPARRAVRFVRIS